MKFPTEIIVAKFALLNAYAIKQTGKDSDFEQALEIVVTAYDGTEEAKQAKRLLDKLHNPKKNVEEPEATSPKAPKQLDRNENINIKENTKRRTVK